LQDQLEPQGQVKQEARERLDYKGLWGKLARQEARDYEEPQEQAEFLLLLLVKVLLLTILPQVTSNLIIILPLLLAGLTALDFAQ
jgi:hypothetical protein